MQKPEKSRDFLFDNYKAMLIILVIIGHFTQPCYKNNHLLYTLKYFIYAFHMPAFIFISGYFSRRKVALSKLVQKVLVPYLIFETLYYFYYAYVLNVDNELPFLKPKFSLWYLLALFVWKAVTPYFKKIPHYFLLSVVMGLAIGLLDFNGEILSIARIFAFFPYFLAGTTFSRDTLEYYRKKAYRIGCLCGIALFVGFLIAFVDLPEFRLSFFYGKTAYAQMGQGPLAGIVVRLLCYGIGFFLTYAFAVLIPDKKFCFSKLGAATMPIYLFHGMLFKYIEVETTSLTYVSSIPETIVFLVFCVTLSFLLTWKPLCKFTDSLSTISLDTFFQKSDGETYTTFSNSNYWAQPLFAEH